jgi:putative transcriptional regulator
LAVALSALLLLSRVSLPSAAADTQPPPSTGDTKPSSPAAGAGSSPSSPPSAGSKPSSPSAADTQHLTSIFLVARSELPDPNFGDSVVLVMNDLGPAPVGIIVNRPTRIPVSSLFPDLKGLAQVHDKLYFGGPVEIDSVWFLFRAAKAPEHAVPACDGVYLSGSRDLLLKLLARDKPMDGLRIYLGHSGWGPGQLEAEIAHGDWKLEHADAAGLFNRKSEHPWPSPEESAESPKNST